MLLRLAGQGMRRGSHACLRLAFLGSLCAAPLPALGVPIYGDDDRKDLYEVADDKGLVRLARSTVALFKAEKVKLEKESAKLETEILGKTINLAATERFHDQKQGAFCSGALVGPDLVLTAGHCVLTEGDCQKTRFVFDFSIPEKGHDPARVPAKNVYQCGKLLKSTWDIGRLAVRLRIDTPGSYDEAFEPDERRGHQWQGGKDWALVKLDRPVLDREPLAINKTGKIGKGTRVFVIGHPLGLPTKIAGNGTVRVSPFEDFFVSDLDIFSGNSGSPVFNAETKLIEGVMSRAFDDSFAEAGGQLKHKVLPQGGGKGVDATRVEILVKDLGSALTGKKDSSSVFDDQRPEDRYPRPGERGETPAARERK